MCMGKGEFITHQCSGVRHAHLFVFSAKPVYHSIARDSGRGGVTVACGLCLFTFTTEALNDKSGFMDLPGKNSAL